MNERIDQNVKMVKARLDARSQFGILKYGVTTAEASLSVSEWLRHLQEELLDAAVYIEALAVPPSPPAPKYRAFRTAEEALPLLGKKIETLRVGSRVVEYVGRHGVKLNSDAEWTYEYIFKHCTHDSHPVGILEEA